MGRFSTFLTLNECGARSFVNASGSERQTKVPHKLISNNAGINVVGCIVSIVHEHAGIQKSVRSNTWKSP